MLIRIIFMPFTSCGFTDLRYGIDHPLERQSKCYKDNGVKPETHTMANWMMNAAAYPNVRISGGSGNTPFTLGRKNWVNLDTVRGAEASAIMYSIVETAKANHLRIYDYLELLLTELPKHAEDKSRDFLEHFLLWSEFIREKCAIKKKSE